MAGRHATSVVLAVTGYFAAGSLAAAQEFCVSCEGPNAVYRCVLEGIGPEQAQPLKVVCVSTLAKTYNHATCSVRGGTVFDCNGPIKRINAQGRIPSAPDGSKPDPVVVVEPPKPVPLDNEPPQTVEEMAKRMNKSAGEGVQKTGTAIGEGVQKTGSAIGTAFKKTGDAIGGAVKKTWTCMTTLFKTC